MLFVNTDLAMIFLYKRHVLISFVSCTTKRSCLVRELHRSYHATVANTKHVLHSCTYKTSIVGRVRQNKIKINIIVDLGQYRVLHSSCNQINIDINVMCLNNQLINPRRMREGYGT